MQENIQKLNLPFPLRLRSRSFHLHVVHRLSRCISPCSWMPPRPALVHKLMLLFCLTCRLVLLPTSARVRLSWTSYISYLLFQISLYKQYIIKCKTINSILRDYKYISSLRVCVVRTEQEPRGNRPRGDCVLHCSCSCSYSCDLVGQCGDLAMKRGRGGPDGSLWGGPGGEVAHNYRHVFFFFRSICSALKTEAMTDHWTLQNQKMKPNQRTEKTNISVRFQLSLVRWSFCSGSSKDP